MNKEQAKAMTTSKLICSLAEYFAVVVAQNCNRTKKYQKIIDVIVDELENRKLLDKKDCIESSIVYEGEEQ